MHDIAAALRAGPPADPRGGGHVARARAVDHASLALGRAGLAVFYAYLARAGLGEGAGEAAEGFLDEAAAALARLSMPPSLYQGFCGVAWAVAHLRPATDLDGAEDPGEEIDAALLAYLEQSPWTDDYDLVSGLVGVGVYALERLPRRSARRLLGRVVGRLDDSAERTRAGIAWRTRPHLLPPHLREICPQGYYNLGLAHGVPGVIALLGHARAAGVAPARTNRLLAGAVRWLRSSRLPPEAGSTFAAWVAPGHPARPTRSAWCHGDPGVAAALLGAGRGAGRTAWRREALAIARRAAARPAADTGVRDAGLCHGAAGLAHIFTRMHRATGDPALAAAARTWLGRTLDLRRPGRGVAGFEVHRPTEDTAIGWLEDAGLLTGAAGIGLALLAATTTVEPAWDRMLLLS